MNNNPIKKLTALAQMYMNRSKDPIHDSDHIERVRSYAIKIGSAYDLTETEWQALMLAIEWHDVSRSALPNVSFMIMFFIDDLISALMLWFWTIRYGLFGNIAGIATRLIFCKSRTTGTPFITLFLNKRNRLLLQILQDADGLDMLSIERTSILCTIANTSKIQKWSYRMMANWYSKKDRFQLYTDEAKKIFIELLHTFFSWLLSPFVTAYHRMLYGEKWCNTFFSRWNRLIQYISTT